MLACAKDVAETAQTKDCYEEQKNNINHYETHLFHIYQSYD